MSKSDRSGRLIRGSPTGFILPFVGAVHLGMEPAVGNVVTVFLELEKKNLVFVISFVVECFAELFSMNNELVVQKFYNYFDNFTKFKICYKVFIFLTTPSIYI